MGDIFGVNIYDNSVSYFDHVVIPHCNICEFSYWDRCLGSVNNMENS